MHCGDIRRVPRVWWLVLGGSTFAGAKSKGHKGGVCRENSLLPASETVKEKVPQQQQGLPPTTFSQVRADITHTLFLWSRYFCFQGELQVLYVSFLWYNKIRHKIINLSTLNEEVALIYHKDIFFYVLKAPFCYFFYLKLSASKSFWWFGVL